jgi:hypothetical protein
MSLISANFSSGRRRCQLTSSSWVERLTIDSLALLLDKLQLIRLIDR